MSITTHSSTWIIDAEASDRMIFNSTLLSSPHLPSFISSTTTLLDGCTTLISCVGSVTLTSSFLLHVFFFMMYSN